MHLENSYICFRFRRFLLKEIIYKNFFSNQINQINEIKFYPCSILILRRCPDTECIAESVNSVAELSKR